MPTWRELLTHFKEGDEANPHCEREESAHGSHERRNGVALLAHHPLDVDLVEVDVDECHVAASVVPNSLPKSIVVSKILCHLVNDQVIEGC